MPACYQPLGAVEIHRVAESDLPGIGDLARHIWRAVYPAIISGEQIEYMLAQRYTDEALRESVRSGSLTFELLTEAGEPTGFAGHGPATDPGEYKLHQLYVLPERHGMGLGSRLLRHVEGLARAAGDTSLVLTVNRQNARAIAAYHRSGFVVRAAADFPIGGGFVMEDFVMAKSLD